MSPSVASRASSSARPALRSASSALWLSAESTLVSRWYTVSVAVAVVVEEEGEERRRDTVSHTHENREREKTRLQPINPLRRQSPLTRAA